MHFIFQQYLLVPLLKKNIVSRCYLKVNRPLSLLNMSSTTFSQTVDYLSSIANETNAPLYSEAESYAMDILKDSVNAGPRSKELYLPLFSHIKKLYDSKKNAGPLMIGISAPQVIAI